MYTFSVLSCLLGFYCFYNTSKKATLNPHYKIELWLQKNNKPARFIGLSLITLSFTALIYLAGYEAGTFASIVLLMATASLVVILSPYKILKWKHFIIILTFSLLMELIIFC